MYAAASGKNAAEMVKLLLAKNADVKARANYSDWPSQITNEPRAQYRPVGGLTALLYAARSGCYDCARELIGSSRRCECADSGSRLAADDRPR